MEDKQIFLLSLAYGLGALNSFLSGSAKGVLISVVTFPICLLLWRLILK